MALSYVQYQGNGSQQTYAIPFQYLKPEDVKLKVALIDHAFTWDNAGTARITPAPAAGAVIEFRRVTERNSRLVDFTDSSVLTESDLDLALTQTFYIVQEAIDIAGGTLELLPDGSYGAGNRRIKNIAPAIEARDAITKDYHDGTFIPQMTALLNQTTTARDTANTRASDALASLSAAVAARDLALQYRDTTKGYRDEVQAWNANVNAKSANVDTKNDNVNAKSANVDTKNDNVNAKAQEAANSAESAYNWAERMGSPVTGTFYSAKHWATQAEASAVRAATFDPTSYHTKLEVNNLLNAKASLAGATFTGIVDFKAAPNTGFQRVSYGDASNTGWYGFYNPDGTRHSYIGYSLKTGALNFVQNTGSGFSFDGGPVIAGSGIFRAQNYAGFANRGVYYFGTGDQYLYYDGSAFEIKGGELRVTSNKLTVAGRSIHTDGNNNMGFLKTDGNWSWRVDNTNSHVTRYGIEFDINDAQPRARGYRGVGWETLQVGSLGVVGSLPINRGGFYYGGVVNGNGQALHVPQTGRYLCIMKAYLANATSGRLHLSGSNWGSICWIQTGGVAASGERTEYAVGIAHLTAGEYVYYEVAQSPVQMFTAAGHSDVDLYFLG